MYGPSSTTTNGWSVSSASCDSLRLLLRRTDESDPDAVAPTQFCVSASIRQANIRRTTVPRGTSNNALIGVEGHRKNNRLVANLEITFVGAIRINRIGDGVVVGAIPVPAPLPDVPDHVLNAKWRCAVAGLEAAGRGAVEETNRSCRASGSIKWLVHILERIKAPIVVCDPPGKRGTPREQPSR